MNEAAVHTKTIVVDDRMSIVGSYNWDMRSTYLDTELMLMIDSEKLNQHLREMNAEDMENLADDVTSISVKACDDYEKETLDLSRFTKLKELKIASRCFNYVSQVRIVGLLELQTVSIGEAAFQNNGKDCKLQIQNCPSLLSITIGNESFKSFSQLEMSGVKSLQSITMGCGCFRDANCVMRNMESLNRVTLGDLCFEKSLHTVIESGILCKC